MRFPAPRPPVPGCPTTFNGLELRNAAWVAVNCGHEVQINDSPDAPGNDPRKTGSIYGFADIGLARAIATRPRVWNDLVVRVVGRHYTVIRNGVVINAFRSVPGVPVPGHPLDPDSSSRGLVGYVGLQAHGTRHDIVSFRDVSIRDLSVAPRRRGRSSAAGARGHRGAVSMQRRLADRLVPSRSSAHAGLGPGS